MTRLEYGRFDRFATIDWAIALWLSACHSGRKGGATCLAPLDRLRFRIDLPARLAAQDCSRLGAEYALPLASR